jgi:acyl phosphate:glycerol-3-phosphate acyltransferase
VRVVAATLIGYLVGSLPTANGLARLQGIDLRSGGSRNPGANNARRLGGTSLFVVVLVVEALKGVVAVVIGMSLGGDWGAVFAGLGAVTGNVYNVWYRFRGGKGLAITLGILLAAWPTVLPLVGMVLGVTAAITRSTGLGTLLASVALFVAGLTWEQIGVGNAWGVQDLTTLLVLSIGIPLVVWQPHWRDASTWLRRAGPH